MTATLTAIPPGDYVLEEAAAGTFVYVVRHALTPELCREAVRRFEAHPEHHYQGRVGQQRTLDPGVKRSTDLTVSDKPEWKDIDQGLFQSMGAALAAVRRRFPFFRGRFRDVGYALQRTLPGEHYHWHIDGGSHELADRQLVALWYLNDVPGPGGETEFLFQDLKIRPEEGKLLLFPPFWTHEHRGVTLEAGAKYVATTWVLFA